MNAPEGWWGRTAQAVATHRRVAHGFVNGYRGVVFQNKCNVCGTVFKILEGTKQHTEKAFARGGCPVHLPRRGQTLVTSSRNVQ